MAAALAVAVCIAYAPALRAPFLFDDIPSVVENPSIRSLWPLSTSMNPPTGGLASSGRPIINLSFALNYASNRLLGIDQREGAASNAQVVSYRVTNILLHLLCGALLFGVIGRTLRSPLLAKSWGSISDRVAILVTAMWLLHPMQSEAIDYVVQRTELLVSLCWLGTLYASIRAWDAMRPRSAVRWRAVAICACLIGMGSKEVMFAAPIIVILYDRVFRVQSWRDLLSSRDRVWFYSLLAATWLWLVWLVAMGARSESVGFNLGMTWYAYLYTSAWAIGHYLSLVFWPHPLLIDYGQNAISGLRPLIGAVIVAALGIATLWAWTRVSAWGWLGFLGAWFFLILGPSSSFIPIRYEVAAERRFYLPLAAVLLLLALGAELAQRRLTAGTVNQRKFAARFRRLAPWLSAGVCVLFAALTFQRSAAYADPERLWREETTALPQNARGYQYLGMAVAGDPRRLAEAEAIFKTAIDLDSTLAPSWIDLAYIATRQGHLSVAERALHHALAMDDHRSHGIAVERYGRVLLGMGEIPRAIPYLERAVLSRVTPENLFWLGVGYLEAGRAQDAVGEFRRCLSLDSEFTVALTYLGRALIESDHPADAVPYLQAAVVREPQSAVNLALLSLAFSALDRSREAIDAAQASTKVGTDAEALVFAGRAMMKVHQAEDARRYFGEAVRIHPDDWITMTRLGLADAALGDVAGAGAMFRRALSMQPDYEAAREALRDLDRRR